MEDVRFCSTRTLHPDIKVTSVYLHDTGDDQQHDVQGESGCVLQGVFESQRFQLHQATRWADWAQRDKISLCGEWELRNRLFQEDHARDCQEIEELRSIRCEEADRARQARSDELSLHQERNPTIVSQLLTQIRELQNKVHLEPGRAAILDCRVIHKMVRVLQETFVDDLHKKDDPSTIQRIFDLQGKEREIEMKRGSLNTSIVLLHLQVEVG